MKNTPVGRPWTRGYQAVGEKQWLGPEFFFLATVGILGRVVQIGGFSQHSRVEVSLKEAGWGKKENVEQGWVSWTHTNPSQNVQLGVRFFWPPKHFFINILCLVPENRVWDGPCLAFKGGTAQLGAGWTKVPAGPLNITIGSFVWKMLQMLRRISKKIRNTIHK